MELCKFFISYCDKWHKPFPTYLQNAFQICKMTFQTNNKNSNLHLKI